MSALRIESDRIAPASRARIIGAFSVPHVLHHLNGVALMRPAGGLAVSDRSLSHGYMRASAVASRRPLPEVHDGPRSEQEAAAASGDGGIHTDPQGSLSPATRRHAAGRDRHQYDGEYVVSKLATDRSKAYAAATLGRTQPRG